MRDRTVLPSTDQRKETQHPLLAGYSEAERLLREGVDIITGGFPCQDISVAGKGAGIQYDQSTGEARTRSGLWGQLCRTIRLVRPRVALVENVADLLNRGMGTVLGDLAEIGYDTEWHCIPASHIGAPHNRDRVWIIADTERGQWRQEPYGWSLGRMGRKQQSLPWQDFWQVALRKFRRMDNGLSYKVDRVDGIRNAIVPQVAEILGETIAERINKNQV